MSGKLAYLRDRLDTSVWLIPVIVCLLSGLLAICMIWFDRYLVSSGLESLLFDLERESARQVLGIIAGSIISVGGVAFSVTMLALTLTSGQYGPRVVRNFLEDNGSKYTLGLFLGTYVYTLVLLSGYASVAAPRISVLLALLLALAALLGFVHLIHRTALDLQADQIIHRIGRQLRSSLVEFSGDAGTAGRSADTRRWRRAASGRRPYTIASNRRGYVQTIDYPGLLQWCVSNDAVLMVRVRAGDFIVDRVCVFTLYMGEDFASDSVVGELNEYILVGPVRTPVQDPEYAITQLTQLAARALSPGINDPGSAVTCVDWFSLALAEIFDRDLPGCVFLDDDERPRLLARVSNFEGIVKAIYAPLRQLSAGDVPVTISLLESLCRLAELSKRPDRLAAIAACGRAIDIASRKSDHLEQDLEDIRQRHNRLRHLTRYR
jgi:uncharacterized membrane protein